MSGLYLHGMEMPKNCYVCPFCDYVSARCDAVKGTPYTPQNRYEARAEWCPLIPVPDHGRLMDKDAVNLQGGPYEYDEWCEWALDQYMNAPIILPADKEGE